MRRLLPFLLLTSTTLILNAHGVGRGTAELSVAGKKISVEYGRPELQGRDMLGRATEGMVWRMGADRTTTLTTEADLQFGETTVPAGTYSLFAKKTGPDSWVLLINSNPNASVGSRKEEEDVAVVPLVSKRLENSIETFTIELLQAGGRQGTFSMAWGNLSLRADFQVK